MNYIHFEDIITIYYKIDSLDLEVLPPELYKSEPEAVLYSWIMYLDKHIPSDENLSIISYVLDYTDVQDIRLPNTRRCEGDNISFEVGINTNYNFLSESTRRKLDLVFSENLLHKKIALNYANIPPKPKFNGMIPFESQSKEIEYYKDLYGYIRVSRLSWKEAVRDAANDFRNIGVSTGDIYPLEDGFRVNFKLTVGENVHEVNYHCDIDGSLIPTDNNHNPNFFLSYSTNTDDTAQKAIITGITPHQKGSLMIISFTDGTEITVPFNPNLKDLFDSWILI